MRWLPFSFSEKLVFVSRLRKILDFRLSNARGTKVVFESWNFRGNYSTISVCICVVCIIIGEKVIEKERTFTESDNFRSRSFCSTSRFITRETQTHTHTDTILFNQSLTKQKNHSIDTMINGALSVGRIIICAPKVWTHIVARMIYIYMYTNIE